ncbi:MAG: uncharacterized protein JWQ01_4847 [Massilia sp.]|nr:uncharacterized protein [Massilia sp.]
MNISVGNKFGRWTVGEINAQVKKGAYYHLCKCDCGKEKLVASSNLAGGKSSSCGCLNRELARTRVTTHGLSKTVEYMTWNRMWTRCTNPKTDRYANYGGRGITVCDRWKSFENFFEDMGVRPSDNHSIGRKENDGPYSPNNCAWETEEEQNSNKSTSRFIEFDGRRLTVSQWASETGISAGLIIHRLNEGIPPPKLFAEGSLSIRPITVDGVTKGTVEWMRDAGIPISSFYHFQRKGLTKEEIVRKYLSARGKKAA